MEAIKLVTGVTPTCWRPPYGDVDDRIRYIVHALNLTTIIWKYDSFADWLVGTKNITAANVDTNYQLFISNETSGTFDKLNQAFKYIVPIGFAFNRKQPYVETNYSGSTLYRPSSSISQDGLPLTPHHRARLLARAQPPAWVQTIKSHLRSPSACCERYLVDAALCRDGFLWVAAMMNSRIERTNSFHTPR